MSKKKLDIVGKINTNNTNNKQLTVAEIELATKLVHTPTPEPTNATPVVVEIIAPKAIIQKGKKVRLSIDISPTLHKKLKIRAVENDTNVMHYVEKLIEQDLGA
jgi:hypothetical protein